MSHLGTVMELDEGQQSDVELLLSRRTFGLFHEPGVGKTPPAIIAASQKTPALITIPAYLIPQWVDAINTWLPSATIANTNVDGREAKLSALLNGPRCDFTLASYHLWAANPPY